MPAKIGSNGGYLGSTDSVEEMVLARCSYLVNVQVLPLRRRFDPISWLSNFRSDEKPFALSLLSNFIFLADHVTERMFVAAFQRISAIIATKISARDIAIQDWQQFVNNVLIVRVPGEHSSDADSAFIFSRLSRDKFGIDENRLLSPEDALKEILAGNTSPMVFVDDFVGSGQQFITMWDRPYQVGSSPKDQRKFSDVISLLRDPQIYYCGVLATEYGIGRIRNACPKVKLSFANILGQEYGAFHPQSLLWPDALRAGADKFLQTVSGRAGVADWRGFHNLGLAFAFNHKVPDASLPIFTATANSWEPLIRGNA